MPAGLSLAALNQTDPNQVQVTAQVDAPAGAELLVQLVGCGTGQARVYAGGQFTQIVLETYFYVLVPDSGAVAFYLFPNDLLECGGVLGATQWQVTYVQPGGTTRLPELFTILTTENPFSLVSHAPGLGSQGVPAPGSPGVITVPASAVFDFGAGTVLQFALTEDVAFASAINVMPGQFYLVEITQPSSVGYAFTWFPALRNPQPVSRQAGLTSSLLLAGLPGNVLQAVGLISYSAFTL